MKFFGPVGYANNVQTSPGVWVEQPVERNYYGDVIRASRELQAGDTINGDISVNNNISIVADAFANENFFDIRYVKWAGAYWTVTSVQIQTPRLILQLGGVYNGQTGGSQPNSGGDSS